MKTEVVRLDGGKGDAVKIEAAAKLLDGSGLVAFPTETVYGIGCAARAEPISRLDELKGRVPDKHYTLHIADKHDVWNYVPRIPLRGRTLIEKGWPGPLTVVFELEQELLVEQQTKLGRETFEVLYSDSTIGIRCPDNEIAGGVLRRASLPIVAPSANPALQTPATSAKEVLSYFDGKINVVLENDTSCRYKKSSTVVKVEAGTVNVLREGVYGLDDIAAMSEVRILFVCTGNTCRSPIAEAFCRKYISEKLGCGVDEVRNMGYKVDSAGILGSVDMPASAEVIDICLQKGIDMTRHHSRSVSRDKLLESNYIFVMSDHHLDSIGRICPSATPKCLLLDDEANIDDPIGGDEKIYRRCAEQIEKALEKRMREIWDEDSGRK
jgi:L-threonylcarbamoyladenylate synthase